MTTEGERIVETVTLSQAKALVECAAQEQSFLLLSPPGVGKSDMIAQAAAECGLECRSLLGTQIAPEDVTGVPYIVGERSVFCPPRVLLPESGAPFCLFLDELPACAPDIQKAFYSLLLERRLGEHPLPPGTWVVAAGNRTEDRALVRTISSALVNRVVILQIRVDVAEWLAWAKKNNIRREITAFIEEAPGALLRPVPQTPEPFSTPRSWASLSRALDRVQQAGALTDAALQALTLGRVSAQDAELFITAWQVSQVVGAHPGLAGLQSVLVKNVDQLDFSVRICNVLEMEGIGTVFELVQRTSEELLTFRNFDKIHVQQVVEELAKYGLNLGMTRQQIDTPRAT